MYLGRASSRSETGTRTGTGTGMGMGSPAANPPPEGSREYMSAADVVISSRNKRIGSDCEALQKAEQSPTLAGSGSGLRVEVEVEVEVEAEIEAEVEAKVEVEVEVGLMSMEQIPL
ncbi:hypothetical protein LX32DRAFT_682039 [Colletotrichum zoysiae]|uniref:Uncharacterized protein n=1 Tax=Colletotrichum zoysiae TaxID=1216348 RepID=A0AAD9M6B1_9PEZI|nr:hypothetical protein LX32DRAFT_682039 [Colletotrichum zoysiae]